MKPGFRLALIVFFVLPASQGMALRCDKGLVDVGDHKAEVLSRCGAPASSELVAVEKSTDRVGGAVVREVPVERWTYNFGPKSFLQILTFRGGILTRIESGDRVPAEAGGGRLLAAIGDTKAEVRTRNGEPFFEELVGTETVSAPSTNVGSQSVTRTEIPVERWTYRFGPGRFMQILTFKGGRLVRIETGDRE